MLESFVAWVLNNYVGEYFRLNTDQLSIALLQGQVDLENVPLRATALSKFDIPVQVKCGVIGSLQLSIPLAHIRSQPWTLRLRDCLALLGPTTAVSQCHDVQTVDKWQQQKRERWLDELETVHKKKLLEQLGIDSAEDTAEQDSWWGASLLSSISNNIQVILENAHIRYECPTYSYGVKIQSLTIQTTNSNWRPGFVQSAEGVNIFKKIDISGFSIYWNPTDDSQQQGDRVRLVPSYEMLREELGSPLATCTSADQFILLPFSLEVRIEQNSSRFPLLRTVPSTPRFKLDIRSQRIELELNRRQIAQIQSLAYDWAQFDRARPHRKWRPLVSVHESPKQWWRFAISRTLDEVRARWPFFPRATVLTRVRLVNGYARAYRRRLKLCVELHREEADGKNDHLSCSPPPISHEDIALIKQIEHGSEFTYNVLYSLREAVFQQMMLKSNINSHLPSSHNESPFEIIKSTKSPSIAHQMSTKGPAPTTGWYGWITNWFTEEANGTDAQKEIKNGGQDANEALYLSMKPPKLTKHKLDPELEAVESRMEAEILQMLNESWDESTILRRDNLLAEIVLNVAKVFFRFSEEKEDEARIEEEKPSSSPSLSDSTTPTSVQASSSAFDIQLLTFDLSRLCSRIHLSPKEHRTEVSLSVADLTVQRVKQQTTTASPSAENSEVSASVGDKKNTVGTIPLVFDGLKSGSDEFDESLIYGFQQKNAQSTHLLLAIGRTYDVNLKEKANERQKRNERRFNFDQKSRPSDAVHSPRSPSSSTFASGQTPNNEEKGHRRVEEDNNAILRLFYKRLAPKLEVYHELNISCAPLSIICDECALSGIFEPFTQKVQQRFVQKQQTHVKEQYEFASSSTDTVTHQLFASVAIPELAFELRSKKAAQDYLLSPKIGQVVPSTSSNINESDAHLRSTTSSFARGNVRSLFMTFSRRNFQRLSKLELDFDDVLLEDVFQGCPEEFPLFNIINDQTNPVEMEHQSKCSSRSCPDLTVCMDFNDVVRLIGVDKTPKVEKHLEHQLQMPLDATAIVDQLLGTSLPPLSSLEAISISNDANDSNKSANSSESLRMSSPEGAAREQNRRRKTMMGTATLKRAIHRRHSLCFVFIDGNSNVEAYNPPYNCQISGHFKDAEIELGLNRRTWILLMDFFGLLNSHNCASKMLQTSSKYRVKCELAARRVHLAMNYSEIGKRLGLCVLDGPKLTVQTDVNIVDEPIQIWLIADALRVTDSVPFCSSLYTERLVIQNSDDDTSFQRPPIRINVLKYRTRDSQCSLREFDMSLTAEVNGNVNYLHTQRFFYAFMDFWLQLAELYEKILFSNFSIKQTDNEQEALADDLVSSFKTRCKVDLRVSGGDINLFVPLSQCSPHAIVVECCSLLHAQNNFCYSSSLRDLITKHLINNQCQSANLLSADADCLLDAMSITLCNVRIGHGIFVPKNGLKDRRKRMERNGIVKCFDAFDGMALFLKADQQIVMDKSDFSLTVDIYRNLSASNSFPNLFVLFRLQDVSFCFTTDFYKLLRGCLDYNFGEVIIPQPETIPVELLEMPEEIDVVLGDKHLVFTLRIVLKKVQLHLLTPISSFCPDVFEKFALLYIRSAKLFYDCFMDAKSEFDFICGGATLEDARADKKAENVFRKIVQPICGLREQRATHSESKDSLKSVGSQSDGQKKKPLLFESHIIMRRDEPPIISLVLAKARVILLMDWIETLKAFILLNADSILPTADGHASFRNVSSSLSNVDLSKSGVLIRSTGSPRFVLPHQKPSVLFPFSSSDNQNTTTEQQMSSSKFVLKVTLKECDLVTLEDARRRDTFALIAHTTAAIIVNNLTDIDQIGSQYEIKQLCFYWCVMDSQTDTWTQLTNETTATATIEFERPPLSSSNCASSSERDGASAAEPQKKYQKCSAVGPASSLVVRPQAKSLEHLLSSTNHQVISVELGTLVIRGLLKDFFIVKCVMDKFIEVWNRFREESIQFWSKSDPLPTTISRHHPLFSTEISAGNKVQKAKTSTTTKFLLKSDNLCVWILEEGNKINTTPFLRFNIHDLRIKSALGKVRTDLNLSIDYYRLRTLPGWEPLLEQCNKIGVDVNFTDINRLSILLKSATGGPIEVTLTQLFIERALDFVAHWNSIRQILLDSEQAQGLDQLRHLFHQQRKNASGKEVQSKCSAVLSPSSCSHKSDEHSRATSSHSAKKTHFTVYDHHRPYDTVADSALTSAVDVQLELDDGLGISLVAIVDEDVEQDGQKQEELCYGRLSGIKLNATKSKATYRINCHVSSIQIDNQIIGADQWHFLFCDPNALKDEPVAGLPALSFEMSFTSTEFFDVYECFRLKLSNACILLDEQLLWRLVHFVQCVLKRSHDQGDHSHQHQQQQQRPPEFGATASGEGSEHGRDSSSFLNSNCYFGTLQLEFGNISLSVLTVDKSSLSSSIRQLKDSYSDQIILFSFENALVTLAPFCSLRCFCAVDRLFDTLGNFYLEELKRQKLNIIFAMDAFGNPMALGNELKEGFQGLIFEGDLAGFAFGLGYGAANSISKVTSSMAQGVGSLTFDEKHEELRRRMRRAKPEQSGPLTHLYGGIKGLGVGVFGGLTAIVKNTITATQEEGLLSGIARGVTTGAIDTVTKPLQGTLDLLEGTASAVKEIVGAPLVRRAHFPDHRLRLSRVCSSLSGLLPAFSVDMAEAQLELMRITGTYSLNDENRLLAVVPFLMRTNHDGARVVQRALISLVQCCIVRQVDSHPSMVTYRILFQHLNTVQLVSNDKQQQQHNNSKGGGTSARATTQQQRLALIEFVCNSADPHKHSTHASSSSAHLSQQQLINQSSSYYPQPHQTLTLWCSDRETAKHLCKQIMRAKALFDRRGPTGGKVLQRNAKKLLPIFTI